MSSEISNLLYNVQIFSDHPVGEKLILL